MPGYRNCDPLAMVAALYPSSILTCEAMFCTVECKGEYFRGHMVNDWKGRWEKEPNASIVQSIDMDKYMELLDHMVQ